MSVSTRSEPFDQGWAWFIMLGGSLWNFVFTGTLKSYGLFYVEFQDWFQCSPSEASTVGLLFGIMLIIAAPISGIVADYGNIRIITMVCGLFAATGIAATSHASSLPMAIVLYGCVTGFTAGIIDVPILSMVGKYFKKYRTFATGVMFAGSSLGTLAIPQIFAVTRKFYGPRIALLVIGGIWFHACVVGALMRPIKIKQLQTKSQILKSNSHGTITKTDGSNIARENKFCCQNNCDNAKKCDCGALNLEVTSCEIIEDSSIETEITGEMFEIGIEQNTGNDPDNHSLTQRGIIAKNPKDKSRFQRFIVVLKSYLLLLRNSSLVVRLLVVNLGALGYLLPLVAIPPFCRELDIDIFRTANLISVLGVVEIPARIGIGYLSERFHCRPVWVLAVTSSLDAAISIAVVCKPRYETLMVFSCVHGLLGGVVFIFMNTMLIEAVHVSQLGRAMALLTILFGAVCAVLTPITSLVLKTAGTHVYVFVVSACAAILGNISYLSITCIERRRTAEDMPDEH